ncbi:MAG: hypothetical protein HKL96_10205 [Phycisphaerales bacterium]|nr:hypothetical protein [Phycisphaerales bacterium]
MPYLAWLIGRLAITALIPLAVLPFLLQSGAVSAAAVQPTDKRLPIPTESQQRPVQEKLVQLFKAKYGPVTPFTVQRFANDMTAKYHNDTGDPLTRYVVLSMLTNLAARNWQPLDTFEAVDDLSAAYRVDKGKLDVEAAQKLMSVRPTWQMARINTPQFVYNTTYTRMMAEIPLADTAGEYKYALQMAQIAVRCAQLLQSPADLQAAEQSLHTQQMLATLWSQAKRDIAALKLKPTDPTLNLRVGLFTWLAEKKHHDGLKLLDASGLANAIRVAKLARNGPPDAAAWLHYFELLQKLAGQTKQPIYSQLITRKITKWFNNQAGNVMPAFFTTLQTASFGDANHLLTNAIAQAHNLHDPGSAAWAGKWQSQQRAMLALHRRYEAAMRQVQHNPDFRPGNAVVGQYLCLIKGQWKVGCNYLLKSGKSRLMAAARSEQAALKQKAALTQAKDALHSARQALRSAPKPKAGNAADPGLLLSVHTAKEAVAKAKAAATAAYVAAAANWWQAATRLKPPLQQRAQARAVHWYKRAYPDMSQAPANIIYRVKRFER